MADVELEPYVMLIKGKTALGLCLSFLLSMLWQPPWILLLFMLDSVSITATLGFRQLQVPSLAHRSQCTKKAERMKKVFTSSLVYFRFVLWRIKLLSTCSRARITSMQIWLRLSFQNHHIHKSQCVCVILFAWNRTSYCDQKKLFRENIRLWDAPKLWR